MMNRSQMLSILNTMSEDKLSEALSAVGVECDYEDPFSLGEEQAEGLETWGAKDVSVEPVRKAPLVDKTKFVREPAQPVRRREFYLGQGDEDTSGLSDYMIHSQGY